MPLVPLGWLYIGSEKGRYFQAVLFLPFLSACSLWWHSFLFYKCASSFTLKYFAPKSRGYFSLLINLPFSHALQGRYVGVPLFESRSPQLNSVCRSLTYPRRMDIGVQGPVVSGVSPNEGPPGTKLTIRGENLGNSLKDIMGVSLCVPSILLQTSVIYI